jgi:hypothetical protein
LGDPDNSNAYASARWRSNGSVDPSADSARAARASRAASASARATIGVSDVGLQREIDVDHAELVGMATRIAGGALARSEISVLLGVELGFTGPVFEDVKRLALGDRHELARGSGADSSAVAISAAWSKEMSPCSKAALRSFEVATTLPVDTTARARPIEVPVTRASCDASSSLRDSPAIR